MRIGINPIAWSNDDLPELGGDTPLETCLTEARSAGYEGIELGCKFPRDATVLGPLLAQHDLLLVSGWHGTRLLEQSVDEALAALEPHQQLLEKLGAPVTIVAEVSRAVHPERYTPLSNRPKLDDRSAARLYEGLARLAERAPIVYHHHMGTVIEQVDEIERLLEATPDRVKLVLDTGHLTYAGGDAVAFVKRWAHRIGHVHLKDVRSDVLERCRDQSFLDAVIQGVFTVPGDGDVDFPAILSTLIETAYDGWLVVEAEQDPAVADPCRFAKLGIQNVRRMLSTVHER